MAAGLGFKTFTSGEVLTAADTNGYLMQGINVFANASARTAAITSPQEGQYSYLKDTNALEYYDGAAWVGAPVGDITAVTAGTGISGGGSSGDVTITNSMATTIDAKGDLIAGTADNAFARLTVGNNGETLVADSSTSTGLRYQSNFAAGKNAIINGAFNVWQRGTSFTANSAQYTVDRWRISASAYPTTGTWSQQTFTPGTAPASGYEAQYFWRYAITTVGSSTDWYFGQRIEDVRTFAGQTATFSFWAKADTTRTIAVGYNQNFGSGGSGTVSGSVGTTYSLTTSWQRFSATVSLPSISGKTVGTSSYLEVFFQQNSALANGYTVDIWGVQLEAGSVATAFQTATGTLQGELAACQRYYVRWGGLNVYQNFGQGYADQTTTAIIQVPLPVTMRVVPTSIDFSTLNLSTGGTNTTVTNCTLLGGNSSNQIACAYATVASGLTTNRPYGLTANNSFGGYIGFSAEL